MTAIPCITHLSGKSYSRRLNIVKMLSQRCRDIRQKIIDTTIVIMMILTMLYEQGKVCWIHRCIP